ncbi:hypothetical protein GE107_10370 [Cohnella sp. CFH 77786]|uniref:cell wall hydrolase n=1 Tax=Cohnella sp. CFH 77786 TaxID=2662265 RepID=UPI001C608D68|nr:cell wall hydrolase [Cohnella sp. CFH 77786]MBW5446465.1 hypothetical protein [Cohnella sp. CFH 77786]
MAVVKARKQDIDMLARLLRAEAEAEGVKGMLLVGNVGINRIRANCSDFKGIRTIPQMIYQPHAFEALRHGMFYQSAREKVRRLAQRAVNGERNWPAKFYINEKLYGDPRCERIFRFMVESSSGKTR